jgi:16S rRNA (cytidine1402-2'-O)-methyltransferase
MAKFYVVATPIGNMEDITLRALKVLSAVQFILCEDTRMTKRLLARHNITTSTLSYHSHSKLSRSQEIVRFLKDGKDVALVSDAGTPGISDPGAELVAFIRHELAQELADGSVKIESIPGPSALTAALSIAGISCASFTFLGFLPHKKGREALFKEILSSERTHVFYESPHRIIKSLETLVRFEDASISAIAQIEMADNKKRVTVCRELTKIFEEVVSGSPTEVLQYFTSHKDKVRGEFVVIVSKQARD